MTGRVASSRAGRRAQATPPAAEQTRTLNSSRAPATFKAIRLLLGSFYYSYYGFTLELGRKIQNHIWFYFLEPHLKKKKKEEAATCVYVWLVHLCVCEHVWVCVLCGACGGAFGLGMWGGGVEVDVN